MAELPTHQHVEVTDDSGTPLGSADVVTTRDAGGVARASFHAEAGHVPTGTRAELVDAVLDTSEVRECERLEATVPSGDAEALLRLHDRVEDFDSRAAGATVLVDAELPPRPR